MKRENSFKISVVVPAFNEAENIDRVAEAVLSVVSRYQDFELIFIDDGSSDTTAELVEKIHFREPRVKLVSFSRNFGHQFALKAGLDYSSGDCVVSLDADLQHPPDLIHLMVEKWQQGEEIVYTVRKDDSVWSFKNLTGRFFYRIFDLMTPRNIKLERGAADFRLLDRAVVDVFRDLSERSLFLRGMVGWVGFRQYAIEYQPAKRQAGDSKYSVTKMAKLAVDGLTSFSIMPLRWSAFLGLTISAITVLYGVYASLAWAFTGRTITGWTSLVLSVLFTAGTQLLMLGIFGEYLGKMYMEAKKRPLYVVRRKLF